MSRSSPPPPDGKALSAELLSWYAHHKRRLPWRDHPDPYRIWISEVMLQQTRVASVEPYYERFLKEFPTVEALARAPLDRVLKLWEGLGYYSRARNLHRAARVVVERHGGRLPAQKDELLKLPGIGRYTAAAILSLAFEQDEVVLDGNVRRVASRVLAVREDPRKASVERQLEEALKGWLPPGRARDFNQALMELGSLICLPKAPRCSICPIAERCRARALGLQGEIPRRARRRPLPHKDVAVGLLQKGGKLLIVRRPPQGLLGGLWDLPQAPYAYEGSPREALQRAFRELGISTDVGEELTRVEHGYSHFRVTLHVFRCALQDGADPAPPLKPEGEWAWVRPRELPRYAFPKGAQKVFSALGLSGLDPDQEREEEQKQQDLQQEEQESRERRRA